MTDIRKLIESIDRISTEGSMTGAKKHKEGAKFGGYWKGTDKNPPARNMGVGGESADPKFLGEPYIREEEDDIEECPACDGTGRDYNGEGNESCLRCGGKGHLKNEGYDDQIGEDEVYGEVGADGVGESYGSRMMADASYVDENDNEENIHGEHDTFCNCEDCCWARGGEQVCPSCGCTVDQCSGHTVDEDSWSDGTDQWSNSNSLWSDGTDQWSGGSGGGAIAEDDIDEAVKPVSLMSRVRDAAPGDQVSKDKQGNFIFRQGYYYRMGMDSDKFADRVKKELSNAGFNVEIIDHGDHFASFRGGASIKASSHFWVKARVMDGVPVSEPIEEADIPDVERNKALAGARVDNRADPEKMAIWWSHYRRGLSNGQADRQARDYADRMTASEPKFSPNPFITKESVDLDESIEDITEELKAAFEDYVKNKSEPEDKKERVTITYNDGHTQTKSVTEKEKKRYETSASVKSVVPTKDSKGRLDDGKLDENKIFRWTDYEYITNPKDRYALVEAIVTKSNHLFESNDKDTVEYFLNLQSLSDTPNPNKKYITVVLGLSNNRIIPLQPVEITEFISYNGDFCSVKTSNGKMTEFPFKIVSDRMTAKTFFFKSNTKFNKFRTALSLKFGNVLSKFGTPREGDSKKLSEGASSQEVGDAISNRISRQKPDLITKYGVEVVADAIEQVASFHAGADELGSSDISAMVKQVIRDLERNYVKESKDLKSNELTPRQRTELARRTEEEKWERHRRNSQKEKSLEKNPKDQPVLDEDEAMMPHAVQLFQLMQPSTRKDAFKYLDMLRKNHGPAKSLQAYRMAQKMKRDNKQMVKPVEEDAPQIDPATGQPIPQNTTPGQQPSVNTAKPITTPQTTAQQPAAPQGKPTAIAAPGQPKLPTAGQAGGAPVAMPPGTPKPASGSEVNTTTTPVQNLATSLQQLAQPGAQLAAKKAATALANIK